jgi:hypothetical protein
LDPFAHGISKLRDTARVTVGGEMMVPAVFGGNGVVIDLRVKGVWDVHEGMKQSSFFGGEQYAIINCLMDIIEHVERSVPVATQGFVGICSKEGVTCSKIGMRTMP